MTTYFSAQLNHSLKALAVKLQAQQLQLCCAESCSGGLVAAACTEISGASSWFSHGVVSYSNQAKTNWLQVPASLIAQHGAVSEPVALAMVQGVVNGKDLVGLSITGIAGPGGGTAAKPVGTVCFGFLTPGQLVSQTCHFSGSRTAVRRASIEYAISQLTQLL